MKQLPKYLLQDPALIAVLDIIESGGYRAYLVGGAVRNALLGEPVADIDISTNARPDNVIKLAKEKRLKTIPTGIDYGTVTVISHGIPFEITTFRRDVETDGRRAVVAFADDLAEDAMRRDFTMNALYADRSGTIIDPVDGLPDLEARRLRFVGESHQRIREDYLRILRFFRFLAWYGRDADPKAIAACADLKAGLDQIARERIGAEMKKLLAAPNPLPAIQLMDQTGVLPQLLRGAQPDALADLLRLEASEEVSAAWPRRLAALAAGRDVCDQLRLSRDEARTQSVLTQAINDNWSLDEAGYRMGNELGRDYALLAADQTLPQDWAKQVEHAANSSLPITAKDLMPKLSGAALGKGLKDAETLWISSGFTCTRQELIDTALKGNSE